MIPEDQQFSIWEPENDPHLWMRCNICNKTEQIAHTPLLMNDQIDPVVIFMQQHEECFYNQQPEAPRSQDEIRQILAPYLEKGRLE